MTEESQCFPHGKEAALKEASQAGKPLLTIENLNLLAKNAEANKELAAQAAENIPAFLREKFFLTPGQLKRVDSLTQSSISGLTRNLNETAKAGGVFHFRDGNTADPFIEEKSHGHPVPTPDGEKSGSVEITTPFGSLKVTWGPKPIIKQG